jgi:hypothetical protein
MRFLLLYSFTFLITLRDWWMVLEMNVFTSACYELGFACLFFLPIIREFAILPGNCSGAIDT